MILDFTKETIMLIGNVLIAHFVTSFLRASMIYSLLVSVTLTFSHISAKLPFAGKGDLNIFKESRWHMLS